MDTIVGVAVGLVGAWMSAHTLLVAVAIYKYSSDRGPQNGIWDNTNRIIRG